MSTILFSRNLGWSIGNTHLRYKVDRLQIPCAVHCFHASLRLISIAFCSNLICASLFLIWCSSSIKTCAESFRTGIHAAQQFTPVIVEVDPCVSAPMTSADSLHCCLSVFSFSTVSSSHDN